MEGRPTSWDERAALYRDSPGHAAGEDLDLLIAWAGARPGRRCLDVATGGGHVARRLREGGAEVVACDAAAGMEPDVVCPAEALPFADGEFDVVVTRIAPHHFTDVGAAVAEMARVSRELVLIEDTLFADEAVEQAERLRDPTHVRSLSEAEWRALLASAGVEVLETAFVEKRHELDPWLRRTGCAGDAARRVRELLAPRLEGGTYRDTKILLHGRVAGSTPPAGS